MRPVIISSIDQLAIEYEVRFTDSKVFDFKIDIGDLEDLKEGEPGVGLDLGERGGEYGGIPVVVGVVAGEERVQYLVFSDSVQTGGELTLLLPVEHHLGRSLFPAHHLVVPYSQGVDRHVSTVLDERELFVYFVDEILVGDDQHYRDSRYALLETGELQE